jgi:hypothetical protein
MRSNSHDRVPWLILALTLAAGFAGFLTLHTIRHAIRLHHTIEHVRPWMSIPYIARSRHVPPEALYRAVGLPHDRHDRRPLGRIAREQGRPVAELIKEVEAAIARAQGQPDRLQEHGSVP